MVSFASTLTAADASRPRFGAREIGATDYTVPPAARFVSPVGDDRAEGSRARPWATVQHAVNSAPAGATIVLRAGLYREEVRVAGKRLTLQPYPRETVWFCGSIPVTGWTRDAHGWRKDGWIHRFSHTGVRPVVIRPEYPLCGYPDMVFIDGIQLRQVGSVAELAPDAFFVDEEHSRLHLGADPAGRTVEAAVLGKALSVADGDGFVLRGVGVKHYGTHFAQIAAAELRGSGMQIEECVFRDNALAGFSVRGPGNRVLHNTSEDNGRMGMHAHHADGMLLEGNRFSRNNREHFRWADGGTKITASRDMMIRGNLIDGNLSYGLWLDVSCYNNVIVHNVALNNAGPGIFYEVSAKGIIASNVSVGNRAGIYLLEANHVQVWNNTTVRNLIDIEVLNGKRDSKTAKGDGIFELPLDDRYPFPDPRITWNTEDVVLRNNILSDGAPESRQLLRVDDYNKQWSGQVMRIDSDHNAFYRSAPDMPKLLAQWGLWPDRAAAASTLAELRAASGGERSSLAIDGGSHPFIRDVQRGDFRLPADSPAKRKGAPLPPAIAEAIGVVPGGPVDIGVLNWDGPLWPDGVPTGDARKASAPSH